MRPLQACTQFKILGFLLSGPSASEQWRAMDGLMEEGLGRGQTQKAGGPYSSAAAASSNDLAFGSNSAPAGTRMRVTGLTKSPARQTTYK